VQLPQLPEALEVLLTPLLRLLLTQCVLSMEGG
jgi:hypothetical protein